MTDTDCMTQLHIKIYIISIIIIYADILNLNLNLNSKNDLNSSFFMSVNHSQRAQHKGIFHSLHSVSMAVICVRSDYISVGIASSSCLAVMIRSVL